MSVVISISIISLLFSIIASTNGNKKFLIVAFCIIGIIQAIHYDYGNDYMGYLRDYYQIEGTPLTWNNIYVNPIINAEIGWIILNYIASLFGNFYLLVFVLSIFINWIYYRFIKDNVPYRWWWYAFFIYTFTSQYFYLINMSMMRQGLAVAICLYSYNFIKKNQVKYAFLLVYVASQIHTSALVFLPFVFIKYINLTNTKFISLGLLSLFGATIFSEFFFGDIIKNIFLLSSFAKYEDYLYNTYETHFGFGFFLQILPFFWMISYLFTNKDKSLSNKTIVLLSCFAMIIDPLGQLIAFFSRISIYFYAFSIASIPIVYSHIKRDYIKYMFVAIHIFIVTFMYVNFFTNTIYSEPFSVYHTIFSAP